MSPDEIPECDKCGYPLYSTPCQHCADEAEKKKRMDKYISECWCGTRAVNEFKREAIKPTPANGRALKTIDAWDPAGQNLYFFGPTGVGKTHMAIASGRKHWRPAHAYKPFWKPAAISRAIRSADSARGEGEFIKRLIAQKILIIDDIGTEKMTEFMATNLYEIVDGRDMEGRGGLIMTSNLDLDGLAEKLGDDRVTSRLSRVTRIVDLSNERDHRLEARRG